MGILEGKVAIVTGGGRGIGRGHCLELARQGAKVVVNDLGGSIRGDGESHAADEAVELIKAAGGEAVANYADVADYEQAKAMIQQAHDAFGKLDILVNNAGIVRDAAIWNMTEDDFDKVMRVHVKGSWAPCHHAARYFREQSKGKFMPGRRIINTTSGAGLQGNFGQTNYATAKAGIAGLTLTLAVELHKIGVTVNCISPGGQTRITSGIPGMPPSFEANELPRDEYHPMDPAHCSPVVAWLASDEAQYVSGQVLKSVTGDLTWLKTWSPGPSINCNGKRWNAETLGSRLSAEIFKVRNAGITTY